MNNGTKGLAIRCCRIIAAVILLALFLQRYDFSSFLGMAGKYLFFALMAVLAGFSFKMPEKGDITKIYAPFCICLILCLTIVISYVLPSRNSAVEFDLLHIVSAVFLAPVFEEMFFRGALISFEHIPASVLLSSVVFALFHDSASFFQVLLLGIALSCFYSVSKRLWIPIICHAANNILALVCMWRDVRLPVFAISLISAVLMYKFGVKNEKEIL